MALSTTASNNNAFGDGALGANTTGGSNNAFGVNAAQGVTTGNNNVCVGHESGSYTTTITTGSQNVMIGNYTNPSAADAQYQVVLGYDVDGSANSTLTFGQQATDTTCTMGGTTWTAPSDARMKEEVETSTAGLSFINELRPVTFKWKKEKDIPEELNAHVAGSEERYKNDTVNHGFIAQEVKEVIDNNPDIKDGFDMWKEDDADGRQRIGEGALVTILTKAVQELSAQVEELKSQPVCKCKGE